MASKRLKCNHAWVAGIIEADGCLMFKRSALSRSSRVPRIRVTCADRDIIEDLYNYTGVGRIRGPLRRSYSRNKGNLTRPPKNPKPLWLWEVNKRNDVYYVISVIRPFLHERRGQAADEITEFIESVREKGKRDDSNPRGLEEIEV